MKKGSKKINHKEVVKIAQGMANSIIARYGIIKGEMIIKLVHEKIKSSKYFRELKGL